MDVMWQYNACQTENVCEISNAKHLFAVIVKAKTDQERSRHALTLVVGGTRRKFMAGYFILRPDPRSPRGSDHHARERTSSEL